MGEVLVLVTRLSIGPCIGLREVLDTATTHLSQGHMERYILVLNAGSSSLKFAAFAGRGLKLLERGQVSGIGISPRLEAGQDKTELPPQTSFKEALELVLAWLARRGLTKANLCGVGHRIVHGGTRFKAPLIVADDDLLALEALRALAPLHLPFGLGVLRDTRHLLPDAPHVACFDTAFHATQSELAMRFPIPRHYFDRGYRRYGFHGLNYEHVVSALPQQTGRPLPGRLLIAHLGSGASMCAVREGKSVATTMGFSTADGLVMGTRTGSIDPGLLVALMRDEALSLEQLEDLLYRRSGLLGLSGISADMRVLLTSDSPDAAEAIEYYCQSAARHAASLVATMGGLDAIVFTGGVGENAAPVRAKILEHLSWLNVPPDNIHVVPADEEFTIARHVSSLIVE